MEKLMMQTETNNISPMVSIICNAYNQASFIRDALNGFLKQKTSFPFEILVHDDASTDDTPLIIKEFEKQYPNLIKAIYQSENQFSQGVSITNRFQFTRAKGKYIALCEGDDYWSDPFKLQKQVDSLIQHPEVDICCHSTTIIDSETGKSIGIISPSSKEIIIPVEEVISGGGGFVATNSILLRAEAIRFLPAFYFTYDLDYTLQIALSLRGGMLFIPEVMSVYRYHTPGSWTVRVDCDKELKLKHKKRIERMLSQLNVDTNQKYSSVISTTIMENSFSYFVSVGNWSEVFSAKFKDIFRNEPITARVKIILKAKLPWVFKILKNSL